MKSYGLATTPSAFDFCLRRFWTPPVIPSHARESAMKRMPNGEDAGPDDFLPMETMQVPPMMAATDRYSRRVYLAPPSRSDPIITGTILPDFASVTTGNETPLARERDVKAFAHTWVAPLSANMSWGRPFVPPVRSRPKPPMMTLAMASASYEVSSSRWDVTVLVKLWSQIFLPRVWRNQAALNFDPSAAV